MAYRIRPTSRQKAIVGSGGTFFPYPYMSKKERKEYFFSQQTRQGSYGKARFGVAGSGAAGCGGARQSRCGEIGMARHGTVWLGKAVKINNGNGRREDPQTTQEADHGQKSASCRDKKTRHS